MEEKIEKIPAIYVMVREAELKPEDAGSYEAPLVRQKALCREFLKAKLGDDAAEKTQIYTRRSDLLLDIERQRVSHLIVQKLDRLGSSREEIEGILFELKMAGVALLVVDQS